MVRPRWLASRGRGCFWGRNEPARTHRQTQCRVGTEQYTQAVRSNLVLASSVALRLTPSSPAVRRVGPGLVILPRRGFPFMGLPVSVRSLVFVFFLWRGLAQQLFQLVLGLAQVTLSEESQDYLPLLLPAPGCRLDKVQRVVCRHVRLVHADGRQRQREVHRGFV